MKYIYFIKNTVNNWLYVGKTNNLQRRWKQHIKEAEKGTNRRLYRAMRKHGIENFSMEIVATISNLKNEGIMFNIEKEYIKENNSYWFGYNDTIGGKGFRFNRPKRGRKKGK